MKGFEYFDHTADMGMRVSAPDLPTLFSQAALGMFNLITPLNQFEPSEAAEVLLEAPNVEELFWKWLRELHYFFSTQHLVMVKFEFREFSEKMVWATCWGQFFDPEKHTSEREVKAVTHHGFKIQKNEKGWEAEVIFDI